MRIDNNLPLKIEELNISKRSYNSLKANGINTITDLMVLSQEELIEFRNLGTKSIEEIGDFIDELQKSSFVDDLLRGNFICQEDKDARIVKTNSSQSILNKNLDRHKIKINMKYFETEIDDHMIMEYAAYKESPIKKIMFYDRDGNLCDDLHINQIGFSVRATNCLQISGYKYISQVLRLRKSELRRIRNMGRKTLEEIIGKASDISYIVYEDDENLDSSYKEEKINSLISYEEYSNEIINEYNSCSMKYNIQNAKFNIYLFLKNNEDYLKNEMNLKDNNIKRVTKKPEILKIFYSNLFFREIIKDHIYTIISSQNIQLSLHNVRQALPEHLRHSLIEEEIISEMISERKLELIDYRLRCRYPTLSEYIETIENEREKKVLSHRLERKTLEEIGSKLDITRERVRQIEKKVLQKRPRIREDDYKQVFQKYDWDLETFIKAYDESEMTYAYLNIVYEKGTDNLELFLNNQEIPLSIRHKAEKTIYKDYIVIGSSRIKKNRFEILNYVLRTYCRDEIIVQEVWELYYDLLKSLDLFDNQILIYPERYFETKLANSKIVLWKFKKKLRYYDFESISLEEIINGLNLKQYRDVEYSTYKFFNDYSDLMKEWDIRDEYELHNLIKKKIIDETNVDIKLLRMPNIEFGRANRDMQVLELLIQNAPIENDKLAKIYEDEYGVKAETVLANYFKCIDEYCHNSVYSIDSQPLTTDEFNLLKNALTKEFYLISDVKCIFKKLFPKGDIALISSYNLKCLGFKVNSNSIYSDKYTSCEQYFRTLILKDDTFDANMLGIAAYSNQMYYHVIQELREEFEILEFSYNKFVNITRLEKIGIYKSDLKEFCDDVYVYGNEEFFTIQLLRKHGFEHRLFELGFDDWFYSSLLKYDSRFKYRRLEGTILFRKSKETVTLNDLFEHLVYRFKKIDIYDFIEFIFEEYGIKVDYYKVQIAVKESGMYYDSIMEKIYIDYDEYFEEV